jgi:uncharacterized protein (DUF433 family)
MIGEAHIHSRITHNPDILRGKPIIRGTRVPVSLIAGFVQNGMTPAQVVEDYPELSLEDVEAAVAFVASEQARTEVRHW